MIPFTFDNYLLDIWDEVMSVADENPCYDPEYMLKHMGI